MITIGSFRLLFSKRGIPYSALLHALLLTLLIFGLPRFLRQEQIADSSTPLEVEFVTQTHVPEHITTVPQTPPIQQIHHALPPSSHVNRQDATSAALHKHDKAQPEDLSHVLENIAHLASATPQTTTMARQLPPQAVIHDSFQNGNPLTPREMDSLREQIRQFWNAPVGGKDAEHLLVTLHLTLSQDGTVLSVTLAGDSQRYASDGFFAAAADAAIRAVKRSSPLKNLPADKYGSWSDMELSFNPGDFKKRYKFRTA